MAEADTGNPYGAVSDKIRDAAKWLIAAAAAVGAAMIAGSQLSSIGELDLGERFAGAVAGAVVALAAVTYVLWQSVRVLVPVAVSLQELERIWNDPKPRADVQALKDTHSLASFDSPGELQKAAAEAWTDVERARSDLGKAPDKAAQELAERRLEEAQTSYRELDDSRYAVQGYAAYELLRANFDTLLGKLLVAAVVGASGITVFAWAANPPEPTPASTDLRGADLTGADLRDADLDGADLSGATLTGADLGGASLDGARLKDVVWSGTTCPDGSLSDDHDATCLGHLGRD